MRYVVLPNTPSQMFGDVNCPARSTLIATSTMADDMQINPQRAKQLAENLGSITSRITTANKSNRNVLYTPIPQHTHTTYLTIPHPGPPHRRLQTQARKRHPSPPPTPLPLTHALWRKLRARTPREKQVATAQHTLAHDRRPTIEQMQAARGADSEPVVREQRG